MATDTEQLILSISADTAQIKRALARLPADAKQAAQGVEQAFARTDPVGRMQQNLSRSMRAVQADAKNLSFQLNDIATGLSTGQSPFMIMNQQMGQVTQILGGQGLTGALQILRTALASSWPMLALVGISALASAALEYFTTSEKEAKKATQELEKHTKAIKELADAYGHLFPELDRVVKRQQDLVDAAKKAEAAAIAQDAAYETLKESTAGWAEEMEAIIAILQELGATPEMIAPLQRAFQDLSKAVDTNKASSKDAQPVIEGLNAVIESGTGKVVELAKALRDQLVTSLDAVDRAADSATESVRNLQETGRTMPLVGADVILGTAERQLRGKFIEGGATPVETMEFIKSKAASQEIADSLERLDAEMAKALAKLLVLLPPTARITSGVRTYEEQARIRARHEAMPGGVAAHPAARAGHSRHEMGTFREGGAAVDIGQGVSMEALRAAVKLVPELEQLDAVSEKLYQRDKVHVQLRGTSLRQEKEAAEQAVRNEEQSAKAAEQRAKQQAEALEQLNEMILTEEREVELKGRINEINANLSLTEDERAAAITRVTAEAAKEAEVEKLVNQAKEAGLAITPQLIAQYEALAQAKVNAIIQDKDIAIANKLAADAEKQRVDALKQLNQQVQQMVGGAITGFISDLRNGVDAGEAFNNMLNRIIDSLINMAVQMAVQSLFNPTGGGGGLLGGLFGVAHSGGIVGQTAFPKRNVDPRIFIGARRMATGGLVGGEVPIIAHRGEMVIPKNMVGRGGGSVDNSVHQQNKISIDMAGTGLVAANSQNAKQVGEDLQKMIEAKLVIESRPGGLLRRVPG